MGNNNPLAQQLNKNGQYNPQVAPKPTYGTGFNPQSSSDLQQYRAQVQPYQQQQAQQMAPGTEQQFRPPVQQRTMQEFGQYGQQNYGQQQSQWAQQYNQQLEQARAALQGGGSRMQMGVQQPGMAQPQSRSDPSEVTRNRDYGNIAVDKNLQSQQYNPQMAQASGQQYGTGRYNQNYGQQQSQWAQQQGQGNQYGQDPRQQQALDYARQQAGQGQRYGMGVQQPGTEAPRTRFDPSEVTRNRDYGNIAVDPNLQSQQYNPLMAQASGQQFGTGRFNQGYGQQQQYGGGNPFAGQQFSPYGGGNPFMQQQYRPPQQFNFPQYNPFGGGNPFPQQQYSFGGGNPFQQQMNPYQMQMQYGPPRNYQWR